MYRRGSLRRRDEWLRKAKVGSSNLSSGTIASPANFPNECDAADLRGDA